MGVDRGFCVRDIPHEAAVTERPPGSLAKRYPWTAPTPRAPPRCSRSKLRVSRLRNSWVHLRPSPTVCLVCLWYDGAARRVGNVLRALVQRVSRHEARLEALEAERRARHADPAADARLLSAIASRFGSAGFTVGDLRRGAAVDADLRVARPRARLL